jgi:hypothetical protein
MGLKTNAELTQYAIQAGLLTESGTAGGALLVRRTTRRSLRCRYRMLACPSLRHMVTTFVGESLHLDPDPGANLRGLPNTRWTSD